MGRPWKEREPTKRRSQQRKEGKSWWRGKPRKEHFHKTLWQAARVNLEIGKMGEQEEMMGIGIWETC